MKLRSNERRIKLSSLWTPLFTMAAYLPLVAGEFIVHHPLVFVFLIVLLLFIAGMSRRVVVTNHRVVEYRPILAWLARAFPFLRRPEWKRRRSLDLEDIASVESSGTSLILKDIAGMNHELSCNSMEEAKGFLFEIRELLAGLRQVKVRVSQRHKRVKATRCPYCRDDLAAGDATPCPECATPHHEECLAIHGECALLGCHGKLPERRRRQLA